MFRLIFCLFFLIPFSAFSHDQVVSIPTATKDVYVTTANQNVHQYRVQFKFRYKPGVRGVFRADHPNDLLRLKMSGAYNQRFDDFTTSCPSWDCRNVVRRLDEDVFIGEVRVNPVQAVMIIELVNGAPGATFTGEKVLSEISPAVSLDLDLPHSDGLWRTIQKVARDEQMEAAELLTVNYEDSEYIGDQIMVFLLANDPEFQITDVMIQD